MSTTIVLDPPPRRILVRGVNWLGDAVMTTPALQRLRERFPEARITLLAPSKLADLWSGHPAVDEVITFDVTESALKVGGKLRTGKYDLGLALPNSPRAALELWLGGIPRRVGYAGSGRALMLTHAVARRTGLPVMRKRTVAEIKRLIAADRGHHSGQPDTPAKEPGGAAVPAAGWRGVPPPEPAETRGATPREPAGGDACATAIYRVQERYPSQGAHHLHHYLHLAAALGCDPSPLPPFIAVSDAELKAMHQRLGLLELAGARVPLFGLNPGAEYGPAKRWPREHFLEAAIELHRRTGCRWVIFGGRADVELAGGIAAQLQHAIRRQQPVQGEKTISTVINLAGQTTLRELCAALKTCDTVLTNDTGPMHLAAAVGTRVVVPFGSTSPELTGPGLPGDPRHQLLKSSAPCTPCFLRECPVDFRCMNGISVERVVQAMLEAG
jgi:ADP-heptose:LPS heptosyltransferase